jgi:L-asparagine transporter-like permease
VLILLLANLFDLSAIASLGSAIALTIYVLITIAHWKMTQETKASKVMLALALLTTLLAILLFSWYTLLTDPQTFAILIVTIILAWVIEAIWRYISKRELKASEVEP